MGSKLTVAIVGLLDKQARSLEATCQQAGLRLRFVSSDSTNIPPADLVVLTRRTSHRARRVAVSVNGRNRVTFHAGGWQTLAALIHEAAGRGQPLAA